jgi:hypothetical protein
MSIGARKEPRSASEIGSDALLAELGGNCFPFTEEDQRCAARFLPIRRVPRGFVVDEAMLDGSGALIDQDSQVECSKLPFRSRPATGKLPAASVHRTKDPLMLH